MRLTVLGSGDAAGIPRPDCADRDCVCVLARSGAAPSRGNSCALVEADGVRLAPDTGAGGQVCDALLLTHYHHDHAGRHHAFSCPMYGPPSDPAFPPPPGVQVVAPFVPVQFATVVCTPIPLNHPIPVHGWVIECAGRRLAWLTDSYGIPSRSLTWLATHPCDLICLDTTFPPGDLRAPLRGHGDVQASLAAIAASQARTARLIHIGHHLQNWLDRGGALPAGVQAAQDGEVIEL
jgi:phosphoribosyl 1,2-cyclic phosphate phosphodiesterase